MHKSPPQEKQENFRWAVARPLPAVVRRLRSPALLAALTVLAAVEIFAWGRKVEIRRKFSPGTSIAYVTHTETLSQLETIPKGLEGFLPPLPTSLVTDQENTMTVKNARADGGAEVESRFEKFEIKSQLPENMTEANQKAFVESEEQFAQSLRGRSLTFCYDRDGQLTDVQGADDLLQQVSAPLREPVFQALKYFLGEVTGEGLYPDHAVSPGDEWQRNLSASAPASLPFDEQGTSTMRFAGTAKMGSGEAAWIDYSFTDFLTPRLDRFQSIVPLAALKAQGLALDAQIQGTGKGRALVALDDGRLLENHGIIDQVLTAHLKPDHPTAPPADPIIFKLTTDTSLEVTGKDPKN